MICLGLFVLNHLCLTKKIRLFSVTDYFFGQSRNSPYSLISYVIQYASLSMFLNIVRTIFIIFYLFKNLIFTLCFSLNANLGVSKYCS